MNRKIYLSIALLGVLGATSCQVYKAYERPANLNAADYRDTLSNRADTSNIASMSWKQIFHDKQLQGLIEEALGNNFDLKNATLSIEQAEAQFASSKMGYLPSLSAGVNGSYSSGDNRTSRTYNAMLTSSWEIDMFGKVLNAKRAAKATLMQSEAYRRLVQTQLISSIANYYYTLLSLDAQLAISQQTLENWKKNVETMELLKKAGIVNQAAVVQSRANRYSVEASIPDLQRQIRETENALSVLLGRPAGVVVRSTLDNQRFDTPLAIGVPAQLLANRPDLQQAEASLMYAYANANIARSMLYPSLTITGSYGFSNSILGAVVNPAQLLGTVGGGLTQPIFNRRALTTQRKVSILEQEKAFNNFQKVLLKAGTEVSNALFRYKVLGAKIESRKEQIKALEESVQYTQELLTHGTTTYIEVLTAQQSLLTAQLNQTADSLQQIQSIIALYAALGGGTK